MVIGDKLRELRETKQLSQGDIEKRTGLLRCYISRVENGQHRSSRRNVGKDGSGDGNSGCTDCSQTKTESRSPKCCFCKGRNAQNETGRHSLLLSRKRSPE